ncbi:ankyrin repeat and fibronectin type-III domain-containing protein 1-like isoform X2 [Mizuhopecten yessoensis]|uniref:ankyrin repeat and fibronectin type-III domain-containing protein 1-like isoform X2 n=1 Tax=Mizuhopecten yessoensis TaxID=6573 RepID=UPI000B45900C|nr:ankyrin repeat and fibronectin type-III domain-containing protein 1-like isoform X2 [Mizuhopecten yessoensis]
MIMEIHKFAKSVLGQRKTKMQDLQRAGSWKAKKDGEHLMLARCRSQGFNGLSTENEENDKEYQPTPSFQILPNLPPMRPRSAWNFDDDTDSTASSETMTSGASEEGASHQRPSSQLFYTTPPKANMVRNQDEKRLESSGGLYKIGRRLSQKDKGKDNLWQQRQRSVSLDCGDGRKIKIFMSENENTGVADVQSLLPTSPGLPAHLLNFGAMNTPNRPKTLTVATPKKRGSTSSEADVITPNRLYDKKKTDRERRGSPESQALFDAVEQQNIDLAKTVLDVGGLHINSTNSEGLTPLDVAVMTNNIPMAKMLLLHGARESPLFQKYVNSRSDRLDALVSEAEKRVVDLSAIILNTSTNNGYVSNTQQKENERQLNHWEFRHKLLKRMKAGYDHARVPDPPSCVSLSVASSSSLQVRFDEPLNHNGAVVTKYKVEWSCFEDFMPLAGDQIVEDMRHLEYEVPSLVKGNKYYIRVSAWNMKGYSPFTPTKPTYAVPSSWRDVEGSMASRTDGKLEHLAGIFSNVKQHRPADASELKESSGGDSPQQRKRKSIKNLFTSAPKFQKALKRGVYMACLLYSGDKVFVTSDDQLPVMEVDENFAGPAVYNDLHWLMKISCNWDDVKSFRQDMDKNTSAGTMHFRNKLLQAISVLQSALGVNDLGQFHHKPLKDINGSIILTTVSDVKEMKSVCLSSGKWVNSAKLLRRTSTPNSGGSSTDSTDSMDILVNSLSEMVVYHQTSTVPLAKGLYLGYLKVQVSVELIQLLVPSKAPNNLPNVKLRNCPNISKEEWEWLQDVSSGRQTTAKPHFQKELMNGSERLFDMLDIPENLAKMHRIYDLEVVEVSSDVTFLLLLPPIENVCIVPGQADDLALKRDFMLLPVKVFETIHLNTYQTRLLSKYSRLSSLLEMDLALAQQAQREAFSSGELSSAKSRVDKLNTLQQHLDSAWKSTRWVMDIITYARDKSVHGGTPVSLIMSTDKETDTPNFHGKSNRKILDNNNSQPSCGSTACDSNEISVGKDNRKIAKFYDPTEEVQRTNGHIQKGRESTPTESKSPVSNPPDSSTNSSGILEVYAAYETGLSKGTRVRLHVTSRTTAREVVHLVVKHLNKALVMKGKSGPTYSEDKIVDFCLVAVIGARERILRDDYQPLRLQNPWTKGRLFVRSKNNLLAAIQQGHATEV